MQDAQVTKSLELQNIPEYIPMLAMKFSRKKGKLKSLDMIIPLKL